MYAFSPKFTAARRIGRAPARPPTRSPFVPFPVARGATSPTTAPLAHHNVFARVRSESAPLSASRACNTCPPARCVKPFVPPPPPHIVRVSLCCRPHHTPSAALVDRSPLTRHVGCWTLELPLPWSRWPKMLFCDRWTGCMNDLFDSDFVMRLRR